MHQKYIFYKTLSGNYIFIVNNWIYNNISNWFLFRMLYFSNSERLPDDGHALPAKQILVFCPGHRHASVITTRDRPAPGLKHHVS